MIFATTHVFRPVPTWGRIGDARYLAWLWWAAMWG